MPQADTTAAVLTVSETAALLRMNRNSVYRALHRGELPSVKVGRRLLVPRAALERLLEPSPSTDEQRADPFTMPEVAAFGRGLRTGRFR